MDKKVVSEVKTSMLSKDVAEKIIQEYEKKYSDDCKLDFCTDWYAEGHYDCIFNGGHCDDEDNGEKAKFFYSLIKENLDEAVLSKNEYIKTFAQLIFRNKDAKIKEHRFEIGDVVGVCSDCMAEFEITGYEGKDFKAKCLFLKSKESSLQINQEYLLKDLQIVLKLR